MGTVSGAFELLAGGDLGAAANLGAAFGIECFLGWNTSGVTSNLRGMTDCRFHVTRLTDDIDVPILSST